MQQALADTERQPDDEELGRTLFGEELEMVGREVDEAGVAWSEMGGERAGAWEPRFEA